MSCQNCGCANCGPGLCQDCINGNRGTGNCNPCNACPENTVDCETLPSALDNFTRQFFGSIERVVIDGEIRWALPCDLDVGLPGNPRLDGEGLACYFLRLFNDGIIGQMGPVGPTGPAGTNGRNAYAVITSAFNAPSDDNPTSQFTIIPTPVVSVGQTVFITTLGWVRITDILDNTTVFTTLVELIPSPSAVILPGSLVLPTGPRGLSITGPQGEQGLKGDKGDQGVPGDTGAAGATGAAGPAGSAATNSNGAVTGGTTDYAMTTIYQRIDFGTTDLQLTLPTAGTYFVLFDLGGVNNSGATRRWTFKLHNETQAADIDKTETNNVINQDSSSDRFAHFIITGLVTTSADGEVISIHGQSSANDTTQEISYIESKALFIKLA